MGGSENRGPECSTLNSRILIIRIPNKVPLIFGDPLIGLEVFRFYKGVMKVARRGVVRACRGCSGRYRS